MIRLKVKEVAKRKGVSQGKLARRADIDIKTLQRIYRRPTQVVVTTDTLDKLSMALQVDVRELLETVWPENELSDE
ncbi:MAG: helix-turn-helix transcriptional regulator [Ktedonobacteraceae bacterium]|nr:helix-turn-helix transcriptional regulator [Ktedonobacteraceae bacterium]